jgi:ectoine hydroxylase-related dioxygenase (phytanoyl-CoA dioxygenase family)
MWFPVDPVSRSSTLEFVAGSHLGAWYMPRSFLDGQSKWFPEGSLAELPNIEADPAQYRILGWELEPGNAVFFHMLTLHAAGGVESHHRRRVLSVRFLGDDMVPRATVVGDVAVVPGTRRRAAGGCITRPSAVPVALAGDVDLCCSSTGGSTTFSL